MKTLQEAVKKAADYAYGQHVMGSMNHPLYGFGTSELAWVYGISDKEFVHLAMEEFKKKFKK